MAGYAPATLYQESRGREMNNTNNYNEPKNNSLKKKRNEYVEKDNLLFVKFSNCDEEFVCDKKYEWAIQKYTWYKGYYGYPYAFINERLRTFHSLIYKEKGKDVDHINGDTKDNRESNLRIVTHSENMFNRKKQKNNSSGTTGVYFDRNRWVSQIYVNKRKIILGRVNNIEDAIYSRKKAEKEYYGYLKEGKPSFLLCHREVAYQTQSREKTT